MPSVRRGGRGGGVSRGERERAVDLLGAHTVAGALSPDDLETRTEAVLAARTRDELAAALHDLPPLPRKPLLVRAAELVALRTHVTVYVAVSTSLVTVWAVTRNREPTAEDEGFSLLWPFWVMLAWGIPLVAHALYALRQPLLRRATRSRPRRPS